MAKNAKINLRILHTISMLYMLVAFFKQCTATTYYLVTKTGEYIPEENSLPSEKFFLCLEPNAMPEIIIDDLDTKKLQTLYAATLDRCKPKQRGFVENFLNNPDTAGDVKNSALAATYSDGSANGLYEFIPRAGVMSRELVDPETMHPITLAILIGMRIKAEALRQIENRKGEQRVRLGITSEWVLLNLKEIVVRTMGYEFDPTTMDRKAGAEFQKSSFQPAAAQRSLEALGREMGMFYDRGPGEKAKSYDEMDEAELDAEIARLDKQIADLERQGAEIDDGET